MPSHHDHHHDSHGAGQGHHDHAHGPADNQALILDLDAEVMADHIAAVAAWLPVQTAPRQIVDLGAGTGAGSFALLRQFPEAQLTAVDSSAEHLDLLLAKAQTSGVSDRLRIVQADLNSLGWPDFGTPGLLWASASMHHLDDPVRALRLVRERLAPDGLVAVVELAGLPRFLPPTAPDDSPGLEERCHAATQQAQTEHMPHRGADWGPLLAAAGFSVTDQLILDVDIKSSESAAVGPYALAALQRVRVAAAEALSSTDLAALDRLLDTTSQHSIRRRDDLAVRTTRTVWAARRTPTPAMSRS